jgi:hypothetical protein
MQGVEAWRAETNVRREGVGSPARPRRRMRIMREPHQSASQRAASGAK